MKCTVKNKQTKKATPLATVAVPWVPETFHAQFPVAVKSFS